jgi:hypothetical protein
MAGTEITLSAALQSHQLHVPPEITLKSPRTQKVITIKSPREGPLKWDVCNKRWVKDQYVRQGTLELVDYQQVQQPLKEMKEFISKEILQHRRNLTARQLTSTQDDLFICAKSVKQLPRFDFDKIFSP